MKILILRFSSIGDIVLTSPVVRCLRKAHPEAEIHYATKKAFASILAHNPYLNKVHLLGDSFMNLVSNLRKEKFDYIIDLHHNQRTFLLKLMLGVKSCSFDKLNYEKWLMTSFKVNKLPAKHIVDRYLDTCSFLAVSNDGEGLDYFIGPNDRVEGEELPAEFRNGFAAWVIGAKQNTKKIPIEKIIAVLQKVTYPVMLLGGKEDRAEGELIIQRLRNSGMLYNAAGLYSLNKSAYLVSKAKVVITNDTGLMHIAAAYKRPIVSIWGNTIPGFGMTPYYGNHKVPNYFEQVNGLDCRPCSKLGYSACPRGHFNCMMKQDETGILQQIRSLTDQH